MLTIDSGFFSLRIVTLLGLVMAMEQDGSTLKSCRSMRYIQMEPASTKLCQSRDTASDHQNSLQMESEWCTMRC